MVSTSNIERKWMVSTNKPSERDTEQQTQDLTPGKELAYNVCRVSATTLVTFVFRINSYTYNLAW